MSTSTATLVHTSSRALATRDAMARVAAASRIEAERIAAAKHRVRGLAANLALATEWVEDVRAHGAVKVGFKICMVEGGKWRPVFPIDGAAEMIARCVYDGDDVEAWGINAAGENVGEAL